jgi:nicotinamidase-related amidase
VEFGLFFERDGGAGAFMNCRDSDFLVVVDMQNDFVDGSLGSREAEAIIPKVAERIRSFSGQVLFTSDSHGENYLDTPEGRNLPVPHCIVGTEGWRLHPEIEELRNEADSMMFEKPTFGCRLLAEYLYQYDRTDGQSVRSVTLVGLCTDICVISNALLLKAFLPEAGIIVDASCCAGSTPEKHKIALEAMRTCQVIVSD